MARVSKLYARKDYYYDNVVISPGSFYWGDWDIEFTRFSFVSYLNNGYYCHYCQLKTK